MPSIAERMASYAKSLASDGNGNPTLDAADMSHADAIPPTPSRGDDEAPKKKFGCFRCTGGRQTVEWWCVGRLQAAKHWTLIAFHRRDQKQHIR